MPEIYSIVLLFLGGFLGGFCSGLLGIGGGIIFIPVLSFFFMKAGITDPDLTKAILANSFFAIIFSGISASIKQYKSGQFFPRQIFYTSLGALGSSLFVSWLISIGDWYNKREFTIFFILVLIFINVRLYLKRKEETLLQVTAFPPYKYMIIGILTGAFAALSGLGGGFIMVMFFVQWLRIDIKQATAVSIGTIPFISIPLVIYYLMMQPINFPPAIFHRGYIVVYTLLPIIAGVIISSPLGVTTARSLKPGTIKILLILLSVLIIFKMISELVTS